MTETFHDIKSGDDCMVLLPDDFSWIGIDCSKPGLCTVSFGDHNHVFAKHDIKLSTSPELAAAAGCTDPLT